MKPFSAAAATATIASCLFAFASPGDAHATSVRGSSDFGNKPEAQAQKTIGPKPSADVFTERNRRMEDGGCTDKPAMFHETGPWSDSDEDDCSWYEQRSCPDYGDDFENYEMNAQEACCACGGGFEWEDIFVEITSKSCEDHGLVTISDAEECQVAALSLGKTVTWGPHGGYRDVVDGCSARFGDDSAHLFFNPVGKCDPTVAVGEWTHTDCECTEGQPCICRSDLPSMRHVPNTYCEYYSTGGSETCAQGDSFAGAWRRCQEDGSDVCMGVMWNSCEGATSDTTVNGAWKLITAGQMIGDADHPTKTCGGKGQALGHWDVFVRN